MSVSSEKWQRVKDLFQVALEREPEQQRAFLADACGGDEELFREIASLLDFDKRAGEFIESPAVAVVPELLAGAEATALGRRIGPYQIQKEIGHGGMGAVYLAARADEQYKKQVAIKLIKRGFDNAFIVNRFLSERQILANLDHPNIARLLDGGATDDGLPYLVMEYVEGSPIDQYCDNENLSLTERLEVFRTVCSAVHYAHRNLVIHRDLKPSNILVTKDGAPKLLDFGIAKILSVDVAGAPSDQTATAVRLMTPDFASPEQVRGENMTTSSDVYSLGVLLYRLLTGSSPYRLTTTSPREVERAVCEQEPEKPSDTVTRGRGDREINSPEENLAASSRRRVAASQLRGDLDNIVLMAMRKEPQRRYASVEQFSEDVRRHLEGLPVIARRATFAYRAEKLIKRHKAGVAATVLVALALIAGIAATLWQARVARAERDKAQQINAFLQKMLGAAAPEVGGINIKVSDLLKEASDRAKTELLDKPEVMADVLLTLGRTYISLGLYDSAEADLRAGMDASLEANGESHVTTAATMSWLGLALVYENKYSEGERISRRAVELQRKLHPEGHEDLGVALYSLGYNLVASGDAKAAEPLLQEAVEVIRKYLGESHGYHLATLGMLGLARQNAGDLDGAESLYRQAIDVGRRVEYRYRIYLAQASVYLGTLLIRRENYTEAEAVLRESESVYREQLGDSNSSIGVVKQHLGSVHFFRGDYMRAEDELRKSLESFAPFFSREHPLVVSSTLLLGLTLTRAGRPAQGEIHLREALEIRRRTLPPGSAAIGNAQSALGECFTAQRRYSEAEPLLTEGYETIKSTLGEHELQFILAAQRLVALYEKTNRQSLAAEYRAKLARPSS